jgi:short-subunit dehydrogenase
MSISPGAVKTALVTGASGGIGYEFSRVLAQQGYNLVLVARGADRLAEVARELAAAYPIKAGVLALDLSQPEAASQLFAEVKRRGLLVDVLVNNAGFGDHGPYANSDWETQRQMIQVNITTLAELTRVFLAEMLQRKSGRILNVGSTGSFTPVPFMAVYAATKAFVLSFSEALSAELQGTGVTVTALCPGVTKTNFFQRAKSENMLLRKLNEMEARDVAQIGYRAMMKGKPRVVAGWFNKIMIASLRLAPRSAVLWVSKRLMQT